jgi:hypothetical protein
LPARIRSGAGWADACILNISSRGLMVYTNGAAKPGTVIELRRGAQIVIARVIWRQNQRVGLASQGDLPVQDIISSETAAAAVARPAVGSGVAIERRRRPHSHDRNRYRSRAFEFVSIIFVGVLLGGIAAVWVEETLAKPLTVVAAALHVR